MSNAILSDYKDGWVPTHVGRVFPGNRGGPGTAYPLNLSRERAGFLWWQVRALQLNVIFTGSKLINGTTANGRPYSYYENISGSANVAFDLGNSATLETNTGAFTGPLSSIADSEYTIFEKKFAVYYNAPSFAYAWNQAPNDNGHTLPTNFTSNGLAVMTLYVPTNGPGTAMVEASNSFWPAITLGVPPMGTTSDGSNTIPRSCNIDFRDAGGVSLGTIPLFRSPDGGPLGNTNANGYVQWLNIW